MESTTYTHRELSKLLGVSETTIKSYRSKFPTFLPVARDGKPVRLHQESLEVCRRIRDLFADGLSIAQTTQELRSEFKEYPANRRLSIRSTARGGEEGSGAELTLRLELLAQAQEQARQRMELLEAEVRNLATLEAASKALVAELLGELRAGRAVAPAGAGGVAAPRPAPAVPAPPPQAAPAAAKAEAAPEPRDGVVTARKIVTVHGRGGPVASYALGREPGPEPLFPEPERPEEAFLDLPAVIRSDRGDFLGLPGGQNVRRLVAALSPEGAEAAGRADWFREGPDAWACAIPLGRAQKRELVFERTTTPRGNLVGLIRRMRLNEAEATPVQLQEIFRQLRDQMA